MQQVQDTKGNCFHRRTLSLTESQRSGFSGDGNGAGVGWVVPCEHALPPPPPEIVEGKISDICIEEISVWPLEPHSATPLSLNLQGLQGPPSPPSKKSIAFGSAPRREADSQPISPLARPAVSHTQTHSLGFLSVADSAPISGENICPQGKQWPNGNAAGQSLFGPRFEPRSSESGGGAAAVNSQPTRIRTADLKTVVGCVRPACGLTAICLPTAWSLLSENF